MNPLEDIRSFLKDRTELQLDESSDSITVLSSDFSGFDVSFREWKNCYIISFGKWHEYLPKNEKGAYVAFGLFKFGLSDSCRLKINKKGNIKQKSKKFPISLDLPLVFGFFSFLCRMGNREFGVHIYFALPLFINRFLHPAI